MGHKKVHHNLSAQFKQATNKEEKKGGEDQTLIKAGGEQG